MPGDTLTPTFRLPVEEGPAVPPGGTARTPPAPRNATPGGVPPMFAHHELPVALRASPQQPA